MLPSRLIVASFKCSPTLPSAEPRLARSDGLDPAVRPPARTAARLSWSGHALILTPHATGFPAVGSASRRTPWCVRFHCARSSTDVGGCAEAHRDRSPDTRPAIQPAAPWRSREPDRYWSAPARPSAVIRPGASRSRSWQIARTDRANARATSDCWAKPDSTPRTRSHRPRRPSPPVVRP